MTLDRASAPSGNPSPIVDLNDIKSIGEFGMETIQEACCNSAVHAAIFGSGLAGIGLILTHLFENGESKVGEIEV
jgi:hypothetical protein